MPRGKRQVGVAELYRGRARLTLIRDLAMGEWSYAEIARAIDVHTSDIAEFAAEYAEEISEVRASLAGKLALETAGLWITKSHLRIAEMQADFEDTEEEIAELKSRSISSGIGVGSRRHVNLNRIRLALLAAVADELGQRRGGAKVAGEGKDGDNVVHYVIEADDIADSLT